MNLNFAENFKRLRKEKGITQEKVAEVLEVSGQSVSRWELGICYPDLEMLPSIANYFDVTVDSLLSNDVNSKEKDVEIFRETIGKLSDDTTESIDFVKEYCRKYPENDYYAYQLVYAIKRHVTGDEKKTGKYMPVLLKTAERLLETRYRSAVIQLMATVCDEKDLEKWLDLSPYYGFSRRYCLVARAMAREDDEGMYIQQGLEALENFAAQLDRRYPDSFGAQKKAVFQRDILKTICSFGSGDVPDGWKLFYAYKQLVLAACLFGNGETEEGWGNFDSAIEKIKYVFSLKDEWLELGGEMFSGLKVSKSWDYAVDQEGNKHRLFGIVRLSFYNLEYIYDLLTYPCWAWFDTVRDDPKYRGAVEWLKSMKEKQQSEA